MKAIHQRKAWLLLSAMVWGLSPLGTGWAATVNVSVGNNFFNPSSTNINVNDTVMWNWIGNNHTTTSTTAGLWSSGVRNSGATFSRQFTSVGSFPYRCTVHSGQNGTITVQAPNPPPTVTVTSPANGAVFAAPASFTFSANASDPGGSVTNVQFLRGTTSLGNDATTPYSVSVSGLASGSYTLSAVASDNLGARGTNAINVSVVNPVPIVLSDMQRLSSTQFVFSYTANEGLRYGVQRSAALSDWTGIRTNTAMTNRMTVLDNAASNNVNFYRVERLPNP